MDLTKTKILGVSAILFIGVVSLLSAGVLLYLEFMGSDVPFFAIPGQTMYVTFLGANNQPIPNAVCYMDDQSSRKTDSKGKVTFLIVREGRYTIGCYCPGTNNRVEGSAYGTSITLNMPSCSIGGSGGGTGSGDGTNQECVDVDGRDVYTKAYVKLKQGGYTYTICTDRCNGVDVQECLCEGGEAVSDTLDCPSGYPCSDGRCSRSVAITTSTQSPTPTTKPGQTPTTTLAGSCESAGYFTTPAPGAYCSPIGVGAKTCYTCAASGSEDVGEGIDWIMVAGTLIGVAIVLFLLLIVIAGGILYIKQKKWR